MSSRTTKGKDNRPITAKELKDFARTFSVNVANEMQKVSARSFSVAMCFDALLTVMDKRRRMNTPKISDEVKALLNSMTKQPAEVAPPEEKKEESNASPAGNEG